MTAISNSAPTFGVVTGKVITDFCGYPYEDYGRDVAIQSDGNIIVAGQSGGDFPLARYNVDGTLDCSFGILYNTFNVTATFSEYVTPVVLDSLAQIYDTELTASGNYGGATLTLLRHGGVNAEDLFSNTCALDTLTEGGDFVISGTAIGTIITNSGGMLLNSIMQQIADSNISIDPEASVDIDWIFSDGNIGSQGSGGALNVTGSTTVEIIPDNGDSLSHYVLSFNIGVPLPELAATGQLVVMAASRYGSLTTVTLDVSQVTLVGLYMTIPMSGTDAYGEFYWLDPYAGGMLFVEIPVNLIVGQDAQAHAWQVGDISNTSYLLTPMTIVTDGAGTTDADWVIGTIGNDTINAGAGDDLIEWRGGNDVLNAGDGQDIMCLSRNGMNYSYQIDAEGVLHIGSYSFSSASMMQLGALPFMIDTYRITKLSDAFFQIERMEADGTAVDSTMTLRNAEKLMGDSYSGFNLMLIPGISIDSLDGGMYIDGTLWDDEISLDAADIGSLRAVWGDTGMDTLVLDFGTGYNKLEFVRNGTAYLLQGTVDASGTVVDLGMAEFSPYDTTITIGNGVGSTSFHSYFIEALHFVSGMTLYDVDPFCFVEVSFQSGAWQNWITGTAKDDTIDADSFGEVNNTTITNDDIDGNGGDDIIDGGSGNDTVYGNGGNDTIEGGAGNDTAEYNGKKADYAIISHDGTWTVADTRDGSPEGTDTLNGIEHLSFYDTGLNLTVQFTPTSYDGSSNTIIGTEFDDQIDADALGVANPWKGSQWVNVSLAYQPVYILGINEFSGIGMVTFTAQELIDLTNSGCELWHGTEKVQTSFTVSGADIISQTGGAYTLHWVGTATQTEVPYSLGFSYDKEGVYNHNDYIYGNEGDDSINAGAGNDIIYGNGGNDTIDGGGDNDTVVLNGIFADYSITHEAGSRSYTITDSISGRDGTDVVTSVENFRFSDGLNDIVAPTVTIFSPADAATDVAVCSDIKVTFSETIQKGHGLIAIHSDSAAGAIVESFDSATSPDLIFSDTLLTINPTSNLSTGTHYFVTFAEGSVEDLAGNHFAGSDTYDFTTATASLLDFSGSIHFWKSGAAIAGVTTSFGIASDSMTTAFDGLYQHLDMADGSYALISAKVSGTVESSAIKANDALAALKIAVGMNPNADGSAVLPYQYLAADVNHDGQVKAADALNILKMAVKLDTAPAKEWIFVAESVGSESMTRTNVVWPDNPIPVTLDMDQELDLIGIVKGDVNGSWVA